MKKNLITVSLLIFLITITGCGGGSSPENGSLLDITACNTITNNGCEEGLSCEYIASGETGCFEPIVLRGIVKDINSNAAIKNAHIVALDANGSVASNIGVTNAEGIYELNISVPRNSDGTIIAGSSVVLRSDAMRYQTFPGGVRQSLPVDLTMAVLETTDSSTTTKASGRYILDTVQTDIVLIPLEEASNTASIFGTVEIPSETHGTLVVAELSPSQGYSAIADINGAYRIFNLPAGTYTVRGYTQGSNYTPASATLANSTEKEVNLSLNSDATATLNGNVQIVNAPGNSATSVIMVVESTFNEALMRGEMPPGLRAPMGGAAPNINGSFTIEDIPTGDYIILAAYENDILVRDPDTCISGTDIIHQSFSANQVVDLAAGFKITEALEVISPGTTLPEAITSANPTFSWKDDSSEDQYVINLFDTFGNKIWTKTIPGTSGSNPSVTYDGAITLEKGMYYQFRVISKKNNCELSQTEDLRGVFYLK